MFTAIWVYFLQWDKPADLIHLASSKINSQESSSQSSRSILELLVQQKIVKLANISLKKRMKYPWFSRTSNRY